MKFLRYKILQHYSAKSAELNKKHAYTAHLHTISIARS